MYIMCNNHIAHPTRLMLFGHQVWWFGLHSQSALVLIQCDAFMDSKGRNAARLAWSGRWCDSGVTMVLIPVLIPVLIVLRLCLVCSPTPVTKIPCGGFLKQMSRPAKSAPFKDISAHAMSYS